jgi:hypothetical protein
MGTTMDALRHYERDAHVSGSVVVSRGKAPQETDPEPPPAEDESKESHVLPNMRTANQVPRLRAAATEPRTPRTSR